MVTLFVNGVSAATASIGGIVSTGGQHTYVGGGDNGTVVPYVGMIDEIRMSNTVRSADWITTEYRNQSSPSTFYSVGSASPGGAVTVSVLPTSVTLLPSQSQPFTATVTGTSNTAVTWSIAPTGIGTFNTSNGTYTAPATQAASQVLTVKATSVADNSKFATATVTLPGPPQPPAVTSVTPSSGTELAQVFAATFSDNVGYQDITEADLLVQTSQTQAAACSAKWTPTGGYYLMNDAGTAWLGPVAAGGSGILQNSQCMLMAAVPAISGSGNNLTVNFGMVFSPTAFTGAKNVYLAATGSGGNSGLQQKGSVTVGAASQLPQNVSASPLGQTGTSQTFAFTVSSPNGFQYSGWLEALFNSELVGPKGCFLYYWAPSQTLELASDDASTWSTGAIGSSGTLQNSQCQVNLQSSTVTQGPNSLTLNVALTFLPALPGPQQVMMQAVDDAGNWANWQTMGTWTTTPVQPGNPAFVSGSPLLGTGMTQTFTYVVSSVNGYTYMRSVQAMFGAGAIYPIPNCYVNYDRLTNQITLLGNSGVWDGTQQSTAMGTGSPINNSQCTVNPAQSSATGSGNNLTVSLNLTFSSSWLGGKNNYLYMYDRGGNQLGWVTVGTWTVGTSPTSGYGNHRAITINHANVPNTDQSNFPVLISGTYSYLANTANGGKLRNANGYDIVFSSDAAGMNLLSFEREKYVATTGEVEFWVKIPTLSHSADTTIYMWYGNASVSADTAAPAQVWDANFKGVWHLANGSTLSGADSTSNGNNGSLVNSPSATAGQIDGGANFNAASSQYITMGNTLNIGATDFTISYWINNPASAQYAAVVSKRNCGGVPYCMYITGQGYVDSGGSGHAAQTVFFFGIGASGPFQSYHTTNNVVDGNWHYVTVARRSGVVAIYVDGANMALTADAANTSSLDFTNPGTFNIGNGASYENGKVDEVRVSPALARSADWIATEYSNQRSPSTFYSVGNEN
jgi:hypothetical protein